MEYIFDILLIFFGFIYLIEIIFLHIGIRKASSVPIQKNFEPTVSIIVAARNEENFIGECLQSIANVDYPRHKLEIIAVNDLSTDRTAEVIRELMVCFPNLKLVSTDPEKGNLRGKTNAVATGIAASTGDILMFTDADCRVPREWVRETVKYFTPGIGAVGGFTLLESHGPFEEMQTIDWIVCFSTASATAGWKIPLTAIGNNLSVRRDAYEEAGGFEKISFSVTEDYALIQAILTKTSFKLNFPLDPGTAVQSNPCQSWKQLYRQKQRWGVGGIDMVTRGLVLMSIAWILKFILLIGVFLASPLVWFSVFFLKGATDSFYIWLPLSRLKARFYFRSILFFEMYYTFYVIVLPFIAFLSKKVVWKERSL